MTPAGAGGVEVDGLRLAFGDRVVLEDLRMRLAPGEFVALVGRSGTGKSTLLRVLAGLEPVAAGGSVRVPARVSVAFQEPRLLPWASVWRNVAPAGDGPRSAVLDALHEVGLSRHADAWPLTLSGGEAQRVSLARALFARPELLLLDEPFGALDALTRHEMYTLLRALCARHRPTVLLVTHDLEEAITLADRVLVLQGSRLAAERAVPDSAATDSTVAAELRRELLRLLEVV